MGLKSSTYEIPVTLETTPAIDAKILTNDITITAESLGGNSGLFRMWFSFSTSTDADFQITVTKLGGVNLTGSPLKLNGDNSFTLKSGGYYRFDIGVRPNDLINLSSSVALTAINEFQIQQIQKGA